MAHFHELRVYYEDTDFSGLVYHASYLRFLERGRTEWLRALGVNQSDSHATVALAFVVRKMRIDFIKPAKMDDILRVETQLGLVGGASLTLIQRILREKTELLTAEVKIAVVQNGVPKRLPTALREAISPPR